MHVTPFAWYVIQWVSRLCQSSFCPTFLEGTFSAAERVATHNHGMLLTVRSSGGVDRESKCDHWAWAVSTKECSRDGVHYLYQFHVSLTDVRSFMDLSWSHLNSCQDLAKFFWLGSVRRRTHFNHSVTKYFMSLQRLYVGIFHIVCPLTSVSPGIVRSYGLPVFIHR